MTSATRQIVYLSIGLALFAAVGVHFLNFTPDDVFITLRYAENLAAGQGAVFNPGERVEGFSNPIFLVWLAALHSLLHSPERMTFAAKLTGLLAGLLALLAMALLARRDPEAPEHWGVPPLLCGLSGYLAFWAGSGMETGLHVLLVVLAVGGYIRALESGRRRGCCSHWSRFRDRKGRSSWSPRSRPGHYCGGATARSPTSPTPAFC